MASEDRVLYTGMTGDLKRRVSEHRTLRPYSFTRRYKITRLVYYEETPDFATAAVRERQVKTYPRAKKIALIETGNPQWEDLTDRLATPGRTKG